MLQKKLMEVRSPKTFKAQPRASEQWEAMKGIGFIFYKVCSGYHEGIRWQEGQVDLCENPAYKRNQHTKDTQGTLGAGANSSVVERSPCSHKALGTFHLQYHH